MVADPLRLTSSLYRRASATWASTAARWRISAAEAAEKEAASRRATDAQVLEDAERLIAAWNERQALRADDLFTDDRRRH